MKILKESLFKLLFILPMLAILVASTGIVSYTVNSKKQANYSSNYSTQKQNNNYTINFIASEDNNSLLLKETESLDFNFEVNWTNSFCFTQHFLEVTQKSFCFSTYKNDFITSNNLPLYDLFCNWKLHIS